MNNILKIFCGSLRRLKIALIVSLLLGIAGIILYFPGRDVGNLYVASPRIDIAVIDNDNSAVSENFRNYLTDRVNMNIVDKAPEKYNEMLINTDISAIIEIPEGLQQMILDQKDVKISTTTLDDYENGAFINLYIDSFMRSAATAAVVADGNTDTLIDILDRETASELTVENAVVTSREALYVQFGYSFSSGFLTMLMFGAGIFVTLAVMDDRQYGTYNRMRASSVTGIQYITGTALASVICSLLVSMPLLLFLVITGAPFNQNVLYLFLINIAYSLFSTGLSIFLALVITHKSTIMMLSGCITGLGSILGGAFFPINENSGILRYLSYLTPQYWFTNYVGYTGIEGSTGAPNPLLNIGVIFLYALLMFLGSAVIFSKRSK